MSTSGEKAKSVPPRAQRSNLHLEDGKLTDTSIHRILTTILRVFLFVALIVFLVEGQWMNATLTFGIGLLTLAPALLSRKFKIILPAELEFLIIVFVFGSLFLGEIRGWYDKFWWWDVFLHTGSGLLLGMLAFLLVYVINKEENIQLTMHPSFVALFSFTFAVAAGGLWEIFEYAMDRNFGTNMQKSGLQDTMWDLIVDSIGAFVVSVFGYWYLKYGTRSYFVDWIAEFVQKNPKMFKKRKKQNQK